MVEQARAHRATSPSRRVRLPPRQRSAGGDATPPVPGHDAVTGNRDTQQAKERSVPAGVTPTGLAATVARVGFNQRVARATLVR
jgi:hypothetical protein